MLTDEIRYRILKTLEQDPSASQRELARQLGVSLGKINFCLRALVDKGLLKTRNFRNADNKWAYTYLLTPRGLVEKAKVTARFLDRKRAEYAAIQRELAELEAEAMRYKAGTTHHG